MDLEIGMVAAAWCFHILATQRPKGFQSQRQPNHLGPEPDVVLLVVRAKVLSIVLLHFELCCWGEAFNTQYVGEGGEYFVLWKCR